MKNKNVFRMVSTIKNIYKLITFAIFFICITGGGLFFTFFKNDEICKLEYGKPVRVTLAWNNNIYEVTSVPINAEELGKVIGSVSSQTSPRPEMNSEISRNTPEGPKIIHDGGKLYEIKKIDNNIESALELSIGEYYICKYIGTLP